MGKRHVLITGSAGRVASILRQHWGDRYRLRLADVRPVADLDLHEEYVELDITDLEAFTAACEGVVEGRELIGIFTRLGAGSRP